MAVQIRKMGFARKIVSEGSLPAQAINGDGVWERKVADLRSYLQLLDMGGNPRERVATFISYDDEGLFITLVTLVDGRAGDHLSGWIYIPRKLNVPVDKIEAAHQLLKDSLQNKATDAELKHFFDEEYPLREVPEMYKASAKDVQEWGCFDLNKSAYTLSQLFDCAYQAEFSRYKAVYIQEKNSAVVIRDHQRFEDLTQTKLRKAVLICPPTGEETKRWTNVGAQLFLNGKPFDKKARMKEGASLHMELRRNGFETIIAEEQKLTSEHDGKPFIFPKKEIKWMKQISTSDFDIRNTNGKQLNDRATIKIDNQIITRDARDGVLFSEDVWNECKATITCTNYKPIDNQVFMMSKGKNKATMHRQPIDYTVTMANGKKANMRLESEYLPEDDSSPLKGYELDHPNVLRFRSEVWKQRIIGFVAAIALFLVVTASVALYAWFTTHEFGLKSSYPFVEVTEVKQNMTETGVVFSDEEDKVSSTAAIAYLDNNKAWHRDSLESFEETKGLFDALNKFDDKKMADFHAQLGSSENYDSLFRVVLVCKDFMKTKQGSTYNNNPEDKKITWDRYANELTKGQEKLKKEEYSADAEVPTSKPETSTTPNESTPSSSDIKSTPKSKKSETSADKSNKESAAKIKQGL